MAPKVPKTEQAAKEKKMEKKDSSKDAKGTKGTKEKGNRLPQLVEEGPPRDPEPPKTFVNPLPLMKAMEKTTPLTEFEHKFVSIANSGGNASSFPRLSSRIQRMENVLDTPWRPPVPLIEPYTGSSYDCYFRKELQHRQELCDYCKEIWRRWPIRPLPPPEIDPFENLLCVGDLDPHFRPARGDIVIFHPAGHQCQFGLRTGSGYVMCYEGLGHDLDPEFHTNDLVMRLGSFTSDPAVKNDAVDYKPYDKVEIRAMTKEKEWRFLGCQVSLVSKIVKLPKPLEPIADSEKQTGGKKEKKGKKSGKDSSSAGSDGNKKPSKKKKPKDKESDKGSKKGKGGKNDNDDNNLQIGPVIPEFTLDEIPDQFNIIPTVQEAVEPHPGETLFKPVYRRGFTSSVYKYNKLGISCGTGEFSPQLGDIVIREPEAWMHEDWVDRKKRPKGSMVKWHKPKPWTRDLTPGMIVLRPPIDRFTRLETIPRCVYTPQNWYQWGAVELYLFDGRKVEPPSPPPALVVDQEAPPAESTDSGMKDPAAEKAGKKDKKTSTGKMKKEKDDKTQDGKEKADKAKDSSRKEKKDDKKTAKKKGSGKKVEEIEDGKEIKKDDEPTKDDRNMLWSYWGRSIQIFDEPVDCCKMAAKPLLDVWRCLHAPQKPKADHLEFFVSDTGLESDLEHAPKVEEIAPPEKKPKSGKKDNKNQDKSKDTTKQKKKI